VARRSIAGCHGELLTALCAIVAAAAAAQAMSSLLFEACIDSPDSAVAAERGGAGRIELCSGLQDGGATPSMGKLTATRAVTTLPIHVLIRPRGGDFLYSALETAELLEDVRAFLEAGVDGIVTGALHADGTVDEAVMRQVMALTTARGVPVTFHRAIDVCADPLAAVTACRQLGVRYILTSGGAPTAMEGADMIRRMVEAAAAPLPAAATALPGCSSELTIIAGGGVTADTAAEIVRRSGVTQLHGTGECTSEPSLNTSITVEPFLVERPHPVPGLPLVLCAPHLHRLLSAWCYCRCAARVTYPSGMVFRKTDPCVYMGGEKVCWRASGSKELHARGGLLSHSSRVLCAV